jgi:hypothetical protein
MALSWQATANLRGPAGSQIYFGNGSPAATLGLVGDCFFATDTFYFYQRTASGWPSTGAYLRGGMGITGVNGASFYSGSGAPTMAANNGDLYVNLAPATSGGAGEVYKYVSGAWADQGYSIQGPAGLRGTQIYNGSGAPDSSNTPSDAATNDYYLDNVSGQLYNLQTATVS